jgi:hypothetical protein
MGAHWTDAEVHKLTSAMWLLKLGEAGTPGFAAVTADIPKWTRAIEDYAAAVDAGSSHDIVRGRAAFKGIIRRINRARIDINLTLQALQESRLRTPGSAPITPPEDTLREAGIGSARQARYQRRFSSLLAGRRPDPAPVRRARRGGA